MLYWLHTLECNSEFCFRPFSLVRVELLFKRNFLSVYPNYLWEPYSKVFSCYNKVKGRRKKIEEWSPIVLVKLVIEDPFFFLSTNLNKVWKWRDGAWLPVWVSICKHILQLTKCSRVARRAPYCQQNNVQKWCSFYFEMNLMTLLVLPSLISTELCNQYLLSIDLLLPISKLLTRYTFFLYFL